MTILDSYAVLAFLKGERAASEVEALIGGGDAAMTALGVAEVLDHLIRLSGVDEEDASLDIAQLGLQAPISVDEATGAAAGRLLARSYYRRDCPVSMADCVAAEVARATARALAASDPPLLDVCHRETIRVVVLPGVDGSRWTPPHRRKVTD